MDTIANTQAGKVRGVTTDGVHTFLGIPYGDTTGGLKRFWPPKPPKPWSGVRDALQHTLPPAQAGLPLPARGPLALPGGNPLQIPQCTEECLNINVWTPALDQAIKRPVIEAGKRCLLGFDEAEYAKKLG